MIVGRRYKVESKQGLPGLVELELIHIFQERIKPLYDDVIKFVSKPEADDFQSQHYERYIFCNSAGILTGPWKQYSFSYSLVKE